MEHTPLKCSLQVTIEQSFDIPRAQTKLFSYRLLTIKIRRAAYA